MSQKKYGELARRQDLPPAHTGQFGRPGNGLTRAVTGFQDSVSAFTRRWTDPRERQLRKTRRAERRAVQYGSVSGFSAATTAGLAVASAPEWTLVAGGGAAAFFAVPAVLAWRRYREYRSAPLPPRMPGRRFVPYGSVATGLMRRLMAAEQSLYQLLLVLAGSHTIPADEVSEISATAWDTADALEAAARDIAAMEHAGNTSKHTFPHLQSAISATLQRLNDGVVQYEGLVSMAAQMASATSSTAAADPVGGFEQRRGDLLAATDRLEALAGALGELSGLGGGAAQYQQQPQYQQGGPYQQPQYQQPPQPAPAYRPGPAQKPAPAKRPSPPRPLAQ